MKYEEQYFKVVACYIKVAQMHFALLNGIISTQDFSGWEKLMMMLLKNFVIKKQFGEGQTEGYLNLENETRQNEKYSLCEKRAMMAS